VTEAEGRSGDDDIAVSGVNIQAEGGARDGVVAGPEAVTEAGGRTRDDDVADYLARIQA
jgi:arginase family enzyme